MYPFAKPIANMLILVDIEVPFAWFSQSHHLMQNAARSGHPPHQFKLYLFRFVKSSSCCNRVQTCAMESPRPAADFL